jgi:ATP-dependent helicase/nuclease subunit B
MGVIQLQILCSPYTEDIENYLRKNININKEKKTLHIVPTLILYRARLKFFRNELKPYLPRELYENKSFKELEKKVKAFVSLFEMDQFLKEGIQKLNMGVLSKSESGVILERILQRSNKTNNLAWFSSSSEILKLFFQFSESGLTNDKLIEIETTDQFNELLSIYHEYLNELEKINSIDYGIASNRFLSELDVTKYEELVLDGGFLPILSKHHQLIERFREQNKKVTFFIPFDKQNEKSPSLKALRTIYEQYVPFDEWHSIQNDIRSSSFFIKRLPKKIFNTLNTPERLDHSFELLKFPTIEEEINYIIQKAKILINRGLTDYKNIAIVTPNPMEMRPMIREVADQYSLNVQVPERPLLHLPTGRGIKTIFDIFSSERKLNQDHYIDLRLVKDLVYSGLVKNTLELKEVIEDIEAFLLDCRTFEQWYKKIDELKKTKEKLGGIDSKYHPLINISSENLDQFIFFINEIEKIVAQFQNADVQTIEKHIEHFMQYFTSNSAINKIDDEIIERLYRIDRGSDALNNITLAPIEFGRRISSFFIEPEDDDSFEKNADRLIRNEILVTGPNNIEFQRYQYIFLCQFTQNMFPEPHSYKWPMNSKIERNLIEKTTNLHLKSENDLNRFYLDRALYYFNVVLNSPDKQLIITYSELKDGVQTSPAHYIHDIAKVFGIEEGNRLENTSLPKIEKLLEDHKVLKTPANPSYFSFDDENCEMIAEDKTLYFPELSIEDLAVYKFCQKRFYYEKTFPNDRSYTDPFLIKSYATATLYEESVKEMVELHPELTEQIDTRRTYNKLIQDLPNFVGKAELRIRELFPISMREWNDVNALTSFHLLDLLHKIFVKSAYIKQQKERGNNNLNVRFYINEEPVVKKHKGITIYGVRDLLVQYNRGTTYRYSISNFKDLLSFHSAIKSEAEKINNVKQWYFETKRGFCNENESTLKEIEKLTDEILEGNYSKTSGGHCLYCNFNSICQEREVASGGHVNN